MKYIISTGCSYGVMFSSMFKFSNGNITPFRVIDLQVDGMGAEYAKRSVIHTINQLLKYVNPSDIYVIVEWSQPTRLFGEIPREFCEDVFENLEKSCESSFVLDNEFKKIKFSLPIDLPKRYKSLNIVMGDKMYANWSNIDIDEFEKNKLFSELVKNYKKYESTISLTTMVEWYLQNIFDLQNYLKLLNIDYSFFLMNNVFEGWNQSTFEHYYTTKESLHELQEENIKIKNMFFHDKIKDFSDYSSLLWKLIDFSKFLFYKTDRFDYGGIDEYAMEEFGHIAYQSAANPWDIPVDGSYVTSFGGHPHQSVYVSFFEEYIYPKIVDWIGELQFDYNDRWLETKHDAIRKTKPLEKISPKLI